MISGGQGEGGDRLRSTEIYDPTGTYAGGCRLPNMPTRRSDTVTKEFLVCGGDTYGSIPKDCVIFDPDSGTWLAAHKLKQNRRR